MKNPFALSIVPAEAGTPATGTITVSITVQFDPSDSERGQASARIAAVQTATLLAKLLSFDDRKKLAAELEAEVS